MTTDTLPPDGGLPIRAANTADRGTRGESAPHFMTKCLALALLALSYPLHAREYTVTAYVATGERTADGHWPKVGRTCAAPRAIPFGTRLHIAGVGWRIVTDRTALKYDGRIDIYVASRSTALKWGKRLVAVERKK